jgi:hypothetical protein
LSTTFLQWEALGRIGDHAKLFFDSEVIESRDFAFDPGTEGCLITRQQV